MTSPGSARLTIAGLTVGYGNGPPAVAGIDLSVATGGCTIVTGAAGSGKSTLLAAACGIVPKLLRPRRFEGSVAVAGAPVASLDPGELFRRVGVVLQAAEDQTWDLLVEDLVAFPLENRGVPRAEIRKRVRAVLGELDATRLLGRRVLSLSGGERRIAVLASALVWQPGLLVLDEPTTGLDPEARARMIGILRRLHESGLTLLIAEQDLAWYEGVADRVAFLTPDGRLHAELGWEEVRRSAEAFIAVGVEPPFAAPPRLADAKSGAGEALAARGLKSRLARASGAPVLDGVDLTLAPGECAVMIGRNGAGKSTLVQSLIGLQPLAAGSLAVGGCDTAPWSVAERARHIAYVPQNTRRMFFLLSVVEEVAFAIGGDPGAAALAAHRPAALARLAEFGLADKAELSPFALSMREQLMLALACVAASAPSVVVIDEPLVAWDSRWRADMLAYIERSRRERRAVLLVTHDLLLADRVADRLLILDGGRVAFDGPAAEGWASPAFVRLGWPRPDRPAALPELCHASA